MPLYCQMVKDNLCSIYPVVLKKLAMNNRILLLYILLAFSANSFAQPATDTRETLLWVQRQADRIETTLHDAVRSQEPVNLVLKMVWAWKEFDGIAQAGVYCHAVRVTAEKGRTECDLLNYDRKQDPSSMVLRATEARQFAHRMRMAAEVCIVEANRTALPERGFAPRDVLIRDAEIVEFDLTDAKSTQDYHILAQKTEHAIRVLRDAEYLAETLENCTEALTAARLAAVFCREALVSNNWDTSAQHVRSALEQVLLLKKAAENCR